MSRLFGSDSYVVLTLFVPCFKLSCPCTAAAKSLHRPFPGSGTGNRRCRSGVQTAFGKTVSESDMNLVSSWQLPKLLRNIQFGIFLHFFDLSSTFLLDLFYLHLSLLRVGFECPLTPCRSPVEATSEPTRSDLEDGAKLVRKRLEDCRPNAEPVSNVIPMGIRNLIKAYEKTIVVACTTVFFSDFFSTVNSGRHRGCFYITPTHKQPTKKPPGHARRFSIF
jgi:hypothetical protein